MKSSLQITALAAMALAADGFSPNVKSSRNGPAPLNVLSFNDEVLSTCDLPGNFGFDPLHLAQSKQQLVTYRKAEMKHGRLAMLAVMAIMWNDLHVVDNLGATPFFEGRAFPEFVGASVGLPAALELYGEQVEKDHSDDSSYFPGQLDLDPFHLYPAETKGQRRMQFAEVMTGRVCMIAAAGRVSQILLDGLMPSSSTTTAVVETMEDLVV